MHGIYMKDIQWRLSRQLIVIKKYEVKTYRWTHMSRSELFALRPDLEVLHSSCHRRFEWHY
jgi:hypothetical protein